MQWENGRLYGRCINGDRNNEAEYMYVHFQKRDMNFTPCLEDEDSFMIIPNEFIKSRAFSDSELQDLMLDDPEYETEFRKKYTNFFVTKSFLTYVKMFFEADTYGKIIGLKRRYIHSWHKIFGELKE